MTESSTTNEPVVLGWREYIEFPEWNVGWVKAKIDTGARTSAIDVESHEILPDERVRFTFRTGRHSDGALQTIETDISRHGKVKSSTGHSHERIFVKTTIRIGELTREIEISLVDRHSMRCRMLLGRTAMEPDLWVDPSARYLHGRPIKRKKKKREKGTTS